MPSHKPEGLYEQRFSEAQKTAKAELWKCLVETYLQKYFPENSTIVDLGCGFCEFINAVKGKKKYGYDREAGFAAFAGPDVEFIVASEGEKIPLADESCDRVFASNFFEHLSSRSEIQRILEDSFRLLKPEGKIVIIQPNIVLVKEAFWDYIDHIIPLSDKSLAEALETAGFRVVLVKRRFLPYTVKRKSLPSAVLLKIYLRLPLLQLILGKQSLMIAEKPKG